MKNFIKYILILSVLGCFIGCKTDLMDYEGDAGVYIAVQRPWQSGAGDTTQWEMQPSTDISFFLSDKNDSIIKIRVQLLGSVVDYDRYFKLVVVDTGTTATAGHDFDELESSYKMAANTHYTDVRITVYKQPDLSGVERQLMVGLEETTDFKLPMDTWYPWPGQHTWEPSLNAGREDISAVRHTIYIGNIVKAPAGWNVLYFGTFTKTKFDKMCEVLGLTINDFSKKLDTNTLKAYGQKMDRYLNNFPMDDEDGNPMKMGTMI